MLGQLALLYELSLSIGQSVELRPACDRFLTTLMARKSLSLSAVWLDEGSELELVYANPVRRVPYGHLPPKHPLAELARTPGWRRLTHAEAGVLRGGAELIRIVGFSLDQRGLLLLGSTHEGAFTDVECNQLRGLMDKFAVSLAGCRAYETRKRQEETLRQAKLLLEAQAEELQQARRAAEEASASKSTFLAQMSHELRTPLTSIIGYTELMASENRGDDPHLPRLRAGAEHLLSLVNNILDFSSIEAGRLQVDFQPVALRMLLQDLVTLITPRAQGKGLRLALVIDPEVPEALVTDPTRLRQVLLNLLGNAVKYTDSGSITLLANLRSTDVHISVKDTGPGISSADQQALFQPFVRVETRADRNSSGLGLSIARQLAQLLGGDVSVQSVLGQGSTFTLRLPDTRPVAPPSRAPAPATDRPDLHGRKLLVVEDSPDIRRILQAFITPTGATVDTAENGLLGVQAVTAALEAGAPYDLILMDVQMPVMNGYEAAEKLHALEPTPRIIIVTAYSTEEDIRRARRAGCVGWLSKPVLKAQIYEALRQHLSASPGPRPVPRSELADNAAMAPLLVLYRADLQRWQADLAVALAEEDWQAVQSLVHRLKGSAGSYGYPRLSADADRVQRHLRGGRAPEAIRVAVSALQQDVQGIIDS